eukprot:8030642-Pyramimonas_sp.AAC.1
MSFLEFQTFGWIPIRYGAEPGPEPRICPPLLRNGTSAAGTSQAPSQLRAGTTVGVRREEGPTKRCSGCAGRMRTAALGPSV